MMKTGRLLLLASSLALAGCGSWHEFALKDSRFTVQIPPELHLSCQQQDSPEGMSSQMCTGETTNTNYVLMLSKLPDAMNIDRVVGGFDSAMNILVQGLPGKVVSSVELADGAYKGRDLQLATSRGPAAARIFIGQGYLVEALASAKGQGHGDDLGRFASSLRPGLVR